WGVALPLQLQLFLELLTRGLPKRLQMVADQNGSRDMVRQQKRRQIHAFWQQSGGTVVCGSGQWRYSSRCLLFDPFAGCSTSMEAITRSNRQTISAISRSTWP